MMEKTKAGLLYPPKEESIVKLLVVVDMQNDFVSGALGTKEAVDIVPHVVGKVEEAVNAGTTLVFTQDTHGANYLATQEGKNLPVPHCIKGTEGWAIIPQLQEYTVGRTCLEKPTFGSIDLAQWAAQGAYDEIELVGLCTDICVISNAMLLKAALPEAKLSVDSACCAGVTPASHNNALEAMKMCQITVL